MAFICADRVMESSTTTGTGALALGGAYTGYRRFSAVMSTSDTCKYVIEALDANGNPSGDWEVGIGTYSALNTLTRTTVEASSNAGAAVNFAAGNKRVMLDASAALLNSFLKNANNLSDVSNASTARTNLGLAIGTDVQAFDTDLNSLAGLTLAQGDILYRNGTQLTNLAAGTSGQVLKTQGAGANPVWASLGTNWTLISSTSPSGASSVDVNGLASYNEVLVIARALTCTVSGVRMAQVSTDNGSTWDTTVANYQQVSQLGVESNADAAAIAYHGTASTSARDLIAHIINLKGAVKVCNPFNYVSNRGPIMYVGSANDITAIRITNSGGGNISGGPIYIFGR